MSANYVLEIYDTADAVCEAAAEYLIDTAREAIAATGRFAVCLSGGHTPEDLFRLMAKPGYRDQIDWSRTFIFWGDERCVGLDDEKNNAFVAKTLLLDKINIPPSNIYPIPVNLEPAAAAAAYEKSVTDFFGDRPPVFDLIFLGLGENGHTASLFPHTAVLKEQQSLVRELYVDEQKMYRITMTAPLINSARNIVFLVTGEGKAAVLKTILQGSYQPDTYPAQLIHAVDGQLYWLADQAAATQL